MDIELLKQKLSQAQIFSIERQKALDEYQALIRPKFNIKPGCLMFIFLLIVVSFVLSIVLSVISNILQIPLHLFNLVLSIFGTIFLMKYGNKIQIKHNKKKYAARLKKLKNIYHNNQQNIIKLGFPPDYSSPQALQKFNYYVLNMRANTLQECVNLYVSELEQQESLRHLHNIQRNQKIQTDIFIMDSLTRK